MSGRTSELGTDTQVVLVTFTTREDLDAYRDRTDLQLTMVRDPDRTAYAAYGLGRGSASRVWGLRAARRYLALFRSQGFGGLHRPTEDSLQLGGDFVVGADGVLRYGFWGEGPDDRPSVDELIAAVRAVTDPS